MLRDKRTAMMLAPAFLALAVLVWIGVPTASVPETTFAEPEDPALSTPALMAASEPAGPVVLHMRTRTPARAAHAREKPQVYVPKSSRSALAKAKRWTAFLRAFYGLKRLATPEAELERLQALFQEVEEPVIRQNLLFLAALVLPAEVVHPWLQAVAASNDAERIYAPDREDALVALAFANERPQVAAFERLANEASQAHVHRLVDRVNDHDAIGAKGGHDARQTLRAYRAIEVLDRLPYFKIVAWHAPLTWNEQGVAPPSPTDQDRLLKAWLARYPGHPGSDDIALRIARHAVDGGRYVEAARWFGRAATLPDQDVAWRAAAGLISCCELLLTPGQLESLSNEEGDLTPNRELMLYIRARRIAARKGFAAGLDAMADIGRYEAPASVLANGWARRWGHAIPRGLSSGLVPLDPSDELRALRQVPERVDGSRPARAWNDMRLEPHQEARPLNSWRLGEQFRLWETLAALEERTSYAHGDARADLLYKQAAVFYHQGNVLFPAYAWHNHGFTSMLAGAGLHIEDPADVRRAHAHFQGETYSLRRAITLFEQIERDHPDYAGMERVIFSRGMAWKRLADYRPHAGWWQTGVRDKTIVQVVATFEHLAQVFPDSTYTDDALRAVAHWRAQRPELWRTKR